MGSGQGVAGGTGTSTGATGTVPGTLQQRAASQGPTGLAGFEKPSEWRRMQWKEEKNAPGSLDRGDPGIITEHLGTSHCPQVHSGEAGLEIKTGCLGRTHVFANLPPHLSERGKRKHCPCWRQKTWVGIIISAPPHCSLSPSS